MTFCKILYIYYSNFFQFVAVHGLAEIIQCYYLNPFLFIYRIMNLQNNTIRIDLCMLLLPRNCVLLHVNFCWNFC